MTKVLVSSPSPWLLGRDIVLDYQKPMMPYMVDSEGLTVNPAKGKLTPVLESFMSSGIDRVMLVTCVSNVEKVLFHIAGSINSRS